MNVAVVEDEEKSFQALQKELARYGNENGVDFRLHRFTDAELFLTGYKANYDLVFMDIKLPGMDGMEAAQRLRKLDENVCLIFTTTMAQFALQGYKVNALDYFVKPYAYYDLKMRLDRVVQILKNKDAHIKIPVAGGMKSVKSADVYYIESDGHFLTYHTTDGDISVRGEPIKNLESKLASSGFARCNNGYLVNLRHCVQINGEDVTLGNGNVLHISRSKKKEFVTRFSEFLQ